jgi:hypothetical protein
MFAAKDDIELVYHKNNKCKLNQYGDQRPYIGLIRSLALVSELNMAAKDILRAPNTLSFIEAFFLLAG